MGCAEADRYTFGMCDAAIARHALTFSVLAVALWGAGGNAAEPGPGAGTLDLPGGGRLPGRLVNAPAAAGGGRDTLLWQAPGFTGPFEFHLDEIRGARFRPAGGRPAGAWKILLAGGDAVCADLEAFDGRRLTVLRGGPRPQRLAIDRAAIERIVRVGPGRAGGYVGPGGLAGWTQAPADSWIEEATGLRTGVRGAAVERDVGGPERAIYDVVLSWRRAAACRLAVAASPRGRDDPYQFELFSDESREGAEPTMVLVREEREQAASEPLAEAAADRPGPRRLRVVLFVDQAKGRLAVVIPERAPEPAADVTIRPPEGRAASGRFRLVGGGDIGLESLRVTEWRGEKAVVERATVTALVRRDGGRVDGDIAPWADGDAAFVVRGAEGETRLAQDEVEELVFAEGDAAAVAEPAIRATCRGEEVVCGDLERIDDDGLWLKRTGIDEPVALPLDALVAIESRRQAATSRPVPGRQGRLRQGETDIRGAVAVAGDRVGFRPVGSTEARPFAGGRDAASVVEYVERQEQRPDGDAGEVGGIGGQVTVDEAGFFVVEGLQPGGAAAADGRMRPGDRILAIAPEEGSAFVATEGRDLATVMNLLRGTVGSPVRLQMADAAGGRQQELELARRSLNLYSPDILRTALAEHARLAPGRRAGPLGDGDFTSVLFLRTGDAVPCAVEAIDEAGIRIRTPLDEAARRESVAVPARLVQAVELVPSASRSLDRQRLERLLTLPRMQRSNPPTHVVRLVDGDYLRGRIVDLDRKQLTLQLADAVKQLPRDAVARVIWLHPEDLEVEPVHEAGLDVAGLSVQGVKAGGERLTLDATAVEGTLIRGRNPAIGPAAIDTDAVDRLLIGAAIKAEAGELPYGQWKLKPAPGPRGLRESGPPDAG